MLWDMSVFVAPCCHLTGKSSTGLGLQCPGANIAKYYKVLPSIARRVQGLDARGQTLPSGRAIWRSGLGHTRGAHLSLLHTPLPHLQTSLSFKHFFVEFFHNGVKISLPQNCRNWGYHVIIFCDYRS